MIGRKGHLPQPRPGDPVRTKTGERVKVKRHRPSFKGLNEEMKSKTLMTLASHRRRHGVKGVMCCHDIHLKSGVKLAYLFSRMPIFSTWEWNLVDRRGGLNHLKKPVFAYRITEWGLKFITHIPARAYKRYTEEMLEFRRNGPEAKREKG